MADPFSHVCISLAWFSASTLTAAVLASLDAAAAQQLLQHQQLQQIAYLSSLRARGVIGGPMHRVPRPHNAVRWTAYLMGNIDGNMSANPVGNAMPREHGGCVRS